MTEGGCRLKGQKRSKARWWRAAKMPAHGLENSRKCWEQAG